MNRGREGLTARIRQIGRALEASDRSQHGSEMPSSDPDLVRMHALEIRVAHLEQLLQGLQDSVYRETQRHERQIAELETRIDPATLASALSKDARERGL